ncbi:MAG: LysR family transcriptional regulator [Oscillospiraceae bacterium]|nr:LysR family transcriptional regulator [Oscillospiraceae bacterium]
MLDFRIATFLQLCETKSYTKTAKLLDITQPSVTQHIKYLQRRYQCKLFSYEGKTLRLTPEGEYLRRQAEAMTKMSTKIVADLQRMGDARQALRFGYPEEFGETAAAKILAQILKRENAPEVSLYVKKTDELITMLGNGQLDFILADSISEDVQFTSEPVGETAFCCYAAKNHEKALEAISQLLPERLLISEKGSADREVLEEVLSQHKMMPDEFQRTMTAGTSVSLRELTAAGIGIQFAYETSMQGIEDRVQKLDISNFDEKRSLVFLYLKENPEAESFKEFLEMFRNAWNENKA